ncbi:MAG: hypothetical protein WBV46_16970, partial [Terriglobales bacterium]
IDYWLGPSDSSLPITLTIKDGAGKIIRKFSSADKPAEVDPKEINVPMYWVRPSRVLSAAPGMHRFVWDLTYPVPDLLSRDFPISAIYHDTPLYPQGATVLPGRYTVELGANVELATLGSAGGLSQPLEIRLDPRVKTSPEDLRRQFDLDRKIAEALHRDFEALQQVRSLRAQIKWLQRGKSANSAASSTALDGAAKIAADLEAKAAAIEGTEGGYGSRFMSTLEGRSLARLNGGLGTMLAQLDTADAAPTTQELEMFSEVEKALNEQLAAWDQLRTKDVPQLNEELKKAGQSPIDLQKLAAAEAASPQTTTQDKDQDVE